MGDIPAAGSGLGSSSTVTVGTLHAIYAYLGEMVTAEQLSREACKIEIEVLGKPIGVQDQYIAAYGGLRFMQFTTAGEVKIERVNLAPELKRQLNESLLLFYTGVTRRASGILREQKRNILDSMQVLREMKMMACVARDELVAGNLDSLGKLLHQSWLLKKQLASTISNETLDAIYDTARRAGALGGKITGAGGGGFLLLFCPCEKRENVRAVLSPLQELPFLLEEDGTKVVFNYKR
jgi:D-glycero-alpha-D-manno-heptose-7-phosphate kinase